MALMNVWQKSFGSQHFTTGKSINKKMSKITKDYYNKVYNKAHRKSKKNKSSQEPKDSIRTLNKEWRKNSKFPLHLAVGYSAHF